MQDVCQCMPKGTLAILTLWHASCIALGKLKHAIDVPSLHEFCSCLLEGGSCTKGRGVRACATFYCSWHLGTSKVKLRKLKKCKYPLTKLTP